MIEPQTRSFLIIRLGALGDMVHTIPAFAALRQAFPGVRIDWVVEKRWAPVLQMVRGIDHVIPLERSFSGYVSCIGKFRSARYGCAIDFQGLYKSALLARFSGAPRRIGRDRSAAREPGAAMFYNDPVIPQGRHVAEMNLSIAARAGAQTNEINFPMSVPEAEIRALDQKRSQAGIGDYMLVSPGGGWLSKCWPAERYGTLCAEIWRRHGLRAIVNAGPGEEGLSREVSRTAGDAKPLLLCPSVAELAALSVRARLVVAADTGPLHLAAALGAKVVALFGPTNPDRNGPLPGGAVLRNASPQADNNARGNYTKGDYVRGDAYSSEMQSLTVEQVLAASEKVLGLPS